MKTHLGVGAEHPTEDVYLAPMDGELPDRRTATIWTSDRDTKLSEHMHMWPLGSNEERLSGAARYSNRRVDIPGAG